MTVSKKHLQSLGIDHPRQLAGNRFGRSLCLTVTGLNGVVRVEDLCEFDMNYCTHSNAWFTRRQNRIETAKERTRLHIYVYNLHTLYG